MIKILDDFQYSVNIGYDLNDENKIKNFIPTEASLELIEKIMLSTSDDSTERARILIGAYGKGKSHMVLVVLSLLFKKNKEVFERVLDKIKDYNEKLYDFTVEYISSDKKLLPVVINGSNTSLSQSFMIALQRTLAEYEFLDILPETNFEAAVKTIEMWRETYPAVYEQFTGIIDKPIDEYVSDLKNYNPEIYSDFEEKYPALTAGSSFNPFVDMNVVEFYEKVSKAVSKKGYNGLYVIYDEFSKYLEANIVNASIDDIKMLQDFAEKCTRSGDKQLHLMLISHKEITNYIDKLPKQKVDGWRGVSERFEHIVLGSDFTQTYEMISNVVSKNENLWEAFKTGNKEIFKDLKSIYANHGIYDDTENLERILDCYPLHPVSTYILPRMSEKVAQNERTLFTFLSAGGKDTIRNYLDECQDKFDLITPDIIYDYFAPQMRKEPYTSYIYQMYVLANDILKKISNDIEKKIVKTIALIYVLDQFERIAPTIEELNNIFKFKYESQEVDEAIKRLIEERYVIYLKRSNAYLRLKKSTGVNIEQTIDDKVEKSRNSISITGYLNKFNNQYMYPNGYNSEYEITRFFRFQFMEFNEVQAVSDWDAYIDSVDADGAVIGILYNEDNTRSEVAHFIKSIHNERLVFIIPKKNSDVKELIYRYYAVNDLKESAREDSALFDEYEIVHEDLYEILNMFVNDYVRPENRSAEYIYNGTCMRLNRKSQFTKLLSDICGQVYSKTPVINNEVINKNELTKVILNSRLKLVQALIRNNLEPNLGLHGNGPEISIMRSTLINTGILKNYETKAEICLHTSDDKLNAVIQEIIQFFELAKSEKRICFIYLYKRLTKAEYGYGLKKGIIPIYLAAVLHEYKRYITIKENGEDIRLTAKTIEQINLRPDKFELIVESWNEDKNEYIKKLDTLFVDYISDGDRDDNEFSFIVNAMRRWYLGLPKYVKEAKTAYINSNFEKIDRNKMKFILDIKKASIGDQELLFERLPKAFGYKEFNINVYQDIQEAKEYFDSLIKNLKISLVNDIKRIYGAQDTDASLTSIIKDWLEIIPENAFNNLFANGAERCFPVMKSITNDEELFVEKLGKTISGLRLEDWNKKIIERFLVMLQDYKATIDNCNSDKDEDELEISEDSTEYKVVFVNEDGSSYTKRFERVEYSRRAEILLNDIETSIDEMGHSITKQEKRQVLMEVLSKLC